MHPRRPTITEIAAELSLSIHVAPVAPSAGAHVEALGEKCARYGAAARRYVGVRVAPRDSFPTRSLSLSLTLVYINRGRVP